MKTERRWFIKSMIFSLAALPFVLKGRELIGFAAPKGAPLPPGMKEVADSDPVANAIGYKKDVKLVDYVKYPQRKKPEAKGQFCENCALYSKTNDAWGKCQMISTGVVSAKGWCGSWSKKA